MRGSRNDSCPPHGHVSFTGNAKGARKGRGGFLKENMKLNWNLQRGGGNKPNLLWMAGGGGVEMENCLEQHRQHNYDVLYIYLYQQRRCYQVVPFSLCPKR